MTDSFPRRQARTRRFTLGAPRGITVSPDGDRVVFLRSRARHRPRDLPVDARPARRGRSAWSPTRATSTSPARRICPPEERARRERSREQAGGVVGYATDRPVTMAAFALVRALYLAELAARAEPAAGRDRRRA